MSPLTKDDADTGEEKARDQRPEILMEIEKEGN